jgi:hypothetical protein
MLEHDISGHVIKFILSMPEKPVYFTGYESCEGNYNNFLEYFYHKNMFTLVGSMNYMGLKQASMLAHYHLLTHSLY